jgi:prophage antirepressor-like protein
MEILPFNFDDSTIRTLTDEDSVIWFVAKDVLVILQDSKSPNVGQATKDLEEDELRSFKMMSGNQQREISFVSESGLYTLIIRSRKPVAKPFQKWVTREVLPSIRKTGSYSLQKEEKSKYAEIISETKEVLQLIDLMKDLSPKELFYLQKIMGEKSPTKLLGNSFQNSSFLPTELGKMTGQSGAEINLILEKKGFQFRDEKGVWRPTENGKEFCIELKNSYNQLKWRLETIL